VVRQRDVFSPADLAPVCQVFGLGWRRRGCGEGREVGGEDGSEEVFRGEGGVGAEGVCEGWVEGCEDLGGGGEGERGGVAGLESGRVSVGRVG
jgi:hypothetical protein